jgi:hypothetical protein
MKACLLFFALCLLLPPFCEGQSSSFAVQANQFLNSLNGEQRRKVLYPFGDEEQYNWHFIPKRDRQGLWLRDLNDQQKELAFTLLKSYLSDQGFRKTKEIIQLEGLLQQLENRPKDDWYRDPENYSFIFFGQPSEKTPWGWRFEGHHLSFTFSTLLNRITSGTPGFMGANPAVVLSGPGKNMQALKDETALGFQLLGTLTPQQLTKTVISGEAPADILTAARRKAMIEKREGIYYSKLNEAQQKLFLQLLSVYVHRYTQSFAAEMMHEIEQAGLEKLQFAWAGARERALGKPHYYRIQGPTIIIEYDNTQNNANHVHTVVRDLKHDFGGDELLQHYQKGHSSAIQ